MIKNFESFFMSSRDDEPSFEDRLNSSIESKYPEIWSGHKEFFKNITKYLNPNADLYISEIYQNSHFVDCAKEVGLNVIEVFPSPMLSINSRTEAIIYHFRYET